MTPSGVYITLFLEAKLKKKKNLLYISGLRQQSGVVGHWSVAGDTVRQDTLGSELQRKLLCSSAQVASY